MATTESVVTLDRFSQGFMYKDYIAQIKVNKDKFEEYYQFQVTPEDRKRLQELTRRPGGPTKMLVLGEDWCPDVYRGMPMLARVAEAAGLEIRIFPRDSHTDIMDEFLKEGQWASIPTAVFYTGDHQYICHWIERPKVAEEEMAAISADIKAQNPDMSDNEAMAARRARTNPRFPAWQQASVEEIAALLDKSIGS